MTTRIEAENTSLAGAYFVESATYASNGSVVRLESTPDATGTCTYTWTGASGIYDIDFMYVAENDGQATMSLSVAGSVVDSWLFVLGSIGRDPTLRQITGVSISNGNAIVVEGTIGAGCNARWDYMDLTLVSGGSTTIYPNGDALSVAPEITQFTLQLLRVFDASATVLSAEISGYLVDSKKYFDSVATTIAGEISQTSLDALRIFSSAASSQANEIIQSLLQTTRVFTSLSLSESNEILEVSINSKRSFSSNAITQAELNQVALINKLRFFTANANTLAAEITQASNNLIFNSSASSIADEIQGAIDTLKVFSSLATSINSAVTSSKLNSLKNFYSVTNTSAPPVSFPKILLFNASATTITPPAYTVLHPVGVQPHGSIKYRSASVHQAVIWSGDLVLLVFELTGARISGMDLIFIVKNISCEQEIFKQVKLNLQNIYIEEVQSNIDGSTTYKGQIYLTTTETLTEELQELNYLLTLENYFNRYIIEKGRFFIKPKNYAAI